MSVCPPLFGTLLRHCIGILDNDAARKNRHTDIGIMDEDTGRKNRHTDIGIMDEDTGRKNRHTDIGIMDEGTSRKIVIRQTVSHRLCILSTKLIPLLLISNTRVL